MLKYTWTESEILAIYDMPLLELLFKAASVHREYHDPLKMQISSLLSVKTGGCPEDCGYCPQSVKNDAKVKVHGILSVDQVKKAAGQARKRGATRMCLGAAWREVRNNRDFDRVLEMVRVVSNMGMEVCCTLGMISEEQAQRLKKAGLHAYNHNIDTSADYYDQIIKTRKYEDRMDTIRNIRHAGISLCTGGIIGMGEMKTDRIKMLKVLSNLKPHPESVPINGLVPVEGTPLEDRKPPEVWDMLRMIATARMLMPASLIRLSAGRRELSREGQALCFLAGANSIFAGDRLLTTSNPSFDEDEHLMKQLGLEPMQPSAHVNEMGFSPAGSINDK